MTTFGDGIFGKGLELKTEVTNGKCPLCSETTVFVSILTNVYRCMNCGADTHQQINGVIKFMPILTSGSKVPTMKVVIDPPEKDGT
jgi:uncharacterized protein (DUF983 family)